MDNKYDDKNNNVLLHKKGGNITFPTNNDYGNLLSRQFIHEGKKEGGYSMQKKSEWQ